MANTHSLDLEASSSQYIYVADSAVFEIASTMTFETWIKFESLPTAGGNVCIANRDPDDNANRVWALSLIEVSGSYRMRMYTSSGGTNATTSGQTTSNLISLSIGVWYHMAWVINGANGIFYLNGVEVGTTASLSASMFTSGTAQLTIGSYDTGVSNFVDGLVDDIRLWDDVRTPTEIANNYKTELVGNEANLIGYWKLNNNLLDSTSNGNNLIFSNYNTTATYTTRVDDDVFGYSTASKEKAAQPFVVTSNGTVNLIDVYYLAKNGSPTGNISAAIYSDSSGSPGTLLELASNTIDASTLPARGTAGPQSFQFSGTTYLSTSSTYWLVLSKSSLDTSNYCWWGVGSSGRPWPDYKVYSGGSWVAGSANYNFDFVLKGTPFSTDTPLDLTDSLVSYWKLDESSGNASDSVGGNTLTNNNSATYVAAKINNGVDLETSSSQSLTCADTASLSITGNMSISCWVTLESLVANQVIIGKWASTSEQRSFAYFVNSSGVLRAYISNDGTNANTSKLDLTATTLSTATMYHLVFVYNASAGEIKLYINGSLNNTSTGHKTSIYNSTAQFGLGNNFEDFAYFDGIIDEVGIWNRILNADEVAMLYNSGSGLTYPFVTGYTITCSTGTFTLTGVATNFLRGYALVCSAGNFVLTGIDTLFKRGYGILCGVGTFIMTGFDTIFRHSGWTNRTKPSTTFTDRTKPTTTFTDRTKPTTNWTNR